MWLNELQTLEVRELLRYPVTSSLKRLQKQELIFLIASHELESKKKLYVRGVAEFVTETYGFLRFVENQLKVSKNDVYLTKTLKLKGNGSVLLKEGDTIECLVYFKGDSKYFKIEEVLKVNDCEVDKINTVLDFDDSVSTFPEEQASLSSVYSTDITRTIDLLTPMGFGQRAIIAAPPKCGKTSLIEDLAIAFHRLKAKVVILMVAERPEETHYLKTRLDDGILVIAANFDESPNRHMRVTNLVIAMCKRMVENGQKVVLFIDSLTRYIRSVNFLSTNVGKIMTGGLDSNAILSVKPILGAGRKLLGGSSLTVVCTMLIQTGSKMDDISSDECIGTSNMDIILSRESSSRGLFPAINVLSSSTRRIENFLEPSKVRALRTMRRLLLSLGEVEALEKFLSMLKMYDNNETLIEKFVQL